MNIEQIATETEHCVQGAIAQIANLDFGVQLSRPPKVEMGDFSFSCFALAKELKTSPNTIAEQIAWVINSDETTGNFIEKVTVAGGYVNIKVNPKHIFERLLTENWISDRKQQVGPVMVEYISPNTNKPLHLGHLRNGAVGMSVSNLLTFDGFKVVRTNLVNDRGIHICKSMVAWLRWGNGETPSSTGIKGDHFVGKWYVRFAKEADNDPHLLEETQEMLRHWEAGDPAVIELWRTMNGWVYEGFSETYQRLGFHFDHFYYESDTYKLGKDIVEAGLVKGVFYVSEGSVGQVEAAGEFDEVDANDAGLTIVDLPEKKEVIGKNGQPETVTWFGTNKDGSGRKATVLRADGTSVYLTQDLGTAEQKFSDFGLSKSIYVVGSEQEPHFQTLFAILEMLDYEWAKQCYHLSYGMVYLPDGKMKSREGKVVDTDNLVNDVKKMAAEEIRKRDAGGSLSDEEIDLRAEKIALGAIKFYLLKVSPRQEIHFDPAASISFEGQTGPYCMYTYARGNSLLAKSGELMATEPAIESLGNDEELTLAHKLMDMPSEMEIAAKDLNPCRVATYVYDLCKVFNQFYHQCPVIDSDNPALSSARLRLVASAIKAIRTCLEILGIEVLESM